MMNCRTIALSTLILTVAGLMPLSAARGADENEDAVMQATAQFYAALNAMFVGEIDPMKAVWSHADDVTYMGPGGEFQVGWDQVRANWEIQAAKKLGGEVRAEGMHFTVGRQIAIAACVEVGENIVDGNPQNVSIRATNIFRKEGGQWKMVGHHTDLLPFLKQ
jgi:ketosteroid isomerase-like protein